MTSAPPLGIALVTIAIEQKAGSNLPGKGDMTKVPILQGLHILAEGLL